MFYLYQTELQNSWVIFIRMFSVFFNIIAGFPILEIFSTDCWLADINFVQIQRLTCLSVHLLEPMDSFGFFYIREPALSISRTTLNDGHEFLLTVYHKYNVLRFKGKSYKIAA